MPSEATSPLDKVLKAKIDRRYGKSGAVWTLPEVSHELVDFSSNDFLSLSKSAGMRSSFLKELTSETTEFSLGSRGSRVLDGNSNYALSLEKQIAGFHNAPSGLLFTSGFDANVSLFSCLPQPGDVIIYDELIHASVHDGMRASHAGRLLPFSHNCAVDFQRVLEQCIDEDESVRSGQRNVFVAIEAIYSMDGDIAPVAELVKLVHRHLPSKNGFLVVDEAHSTGVIGDRGRGVVYDLGLESQIFARLHTFGKAPACTGAVVLCSPLVRLYLINFARPLIFTTSMAFPSLAAIKASYSMMQSVNINASIQHARSLMYNLHHRLQGLATRTAIPNGSESAIIVPEECPRGLIMPLLTRKAVNLAAFCIERGFSMNAVWPPVVPPGKERIRICVHAANTQGELDGFVLAIEDWLEQVVGNGGQQVVGNDS